MRRGAELGVDALWGDGFSARVAYTYIRAVVAQAYYTCVGAPCKPLVVINGKAPFPLPANEVLVAAGSRLPAVPMDALYAGLTWKYAPWGFSSTVEAQSRARIYTDDRNSDAAAGYWVANVRAGLEQESKRWRFSEYARLDNLANRDYVGSVIVNESNSRFFEAAPGRAAYIMFNAALRAE
jgi:iron complex outermembrane receptor protein